MNRFSRNLEQRTVTDGVVESVQECLYLDLVDVKFKATGV